MKKKEERENRGGTEQTWGGVFGVSILRFPFEVEFSFQMLVAGIGGEQEGQAKNWYGVFDVCVLIVKRSCLVSVLKY